MAAAQKLAKSAPVGKTFVVMLPDTCERFLSSPLFADVSNDDWLAAQ